jgi:alginate O-acetyltransferase complex protein AlgI
MIPQFRQSRLYAVRAAPFAAGLTVFILGLFKKVVLADSVAAYANPLFTLPTPNQPTLVAAWSGALAYTLQIYFDFSAYCDMAIGVSRIMNIRLPANFESPYKACSIIDFWRRWHITLSRFLRDYLYIPLGGNRRGPGRRYVNLLATMVLGGLWHGAGWSFIVWGGLHGSYLAINHAWRTVRLQLRIRPAGGPACCVAAWGATFVSVVVAWVFFRAPDLGTAVAIIQGMTGLNGICTDALRDAGGAAGLFWIGGLLSIALLAPNLREIFRRYDIVLDVETRTEPALLAQSVSSLHWAPTIAWGGATFVAFLIALLHMTRVSQFLYFQF